MTNITKDSGEKKATAKDVEIKFPEYQLEGSQKIPPPEDIIDEYDPYNDREVHKPTSNLDTGIYMVKGNIGTGILAMPQAFMHSGLAVGAAGLVVIGYLCVHCMHILLSCSHDLCKRTRRPYLQFAQVGELSFQNGPPCLRPFAYVARIIIDALLCITQLGFCTVFFVFCAATAKQLVYETFDYDMSIQAYLLILLVPMILLNWILNLKPLTMIITWGNLFLITGLVIIFYYILRDFPTSNDETNIELVFGSWQGLPLYFGTALYSFVAIGVVLPLEHKMKTPKSFGGTCGVLNVSMMIVAGLYLLVGSVGYIKYGNEATGSVTLNLPKGEWLAMSVRLVMALSVFFSYAIHFYVPVNVSWPAVKKLLPCSIKNSIGERIYRALLVLLTFFVAIGVPNLGLFISLVGAFCSSTLGLIFPPIFGLLCNWQDGYGFLRWKLVKDCCLIFIGGACCFAATYISILEIIKFEQQNK